MALETGTFISDLVATNPTASDPKSQGDDHLRLVKSTVKATFPNVTGAVTVTHTDLNTVTAKASLASPAFTGTPTAPTAALGTSTTQLATTAFVANTAFSSALPAQTGNAGKYVTTNGTTASWATLTITGSGGTTGTGNITLTASSPAAMTITPATPGLYVTLPDATTCTKADNLFSIYNAGDYDYGVKDSAGTQLGWIRSRTGAMIGLADNATAAGTWAYYGLEKFGTTATYINTTVTSMSNSPSVVRIALDTNRTCFLFGGTSCYAVVYDASTQIWGSATLVQSAIATQAYLGILSATNQVLVASALSSTTIPFRTLTISGTSVTVNAAVNLTASTTVSSLLNIIAVPAASAFVLAYAAGSNCAIVSATVSGTVPSVGAENNLFVNGPVNLYISGSVLRAVVSSATVLYSKPFTVSSTTLTAGTQATTSVTDATFRSFLNGNGNIVCQHLNTTNFVSIFKLTGTTESVSSISVGTAVTAISAYTDYYQVTAGKTLVTSVVTGNTIYANIVTDTAGTATAGTQISQTVENGLSTPPVPYYANGTNVYAITNNSTTLQQFIFDCSGTSPVFVTPTAQKYVQNAAVYTYIYVSKLNGQRNPANLYSGSSAIVIGFQNIPTLRVNPGGINIISYYAPNTGNGIIGANSNESFYSLNSGSSGVGMLIWKVEAAA